MLKIDMLSAPFSRCHSIPGRKPRVADSRGWIEVDVRGRHWKPEVGSAPEALQPLQRSGSLWGTCGATRIGKQGKRPNLAGSGAQGTKRTTINVIHFSAIMRRPCRRLQPICARLLRAPLLGAQYQNRTRAVGIRSCTSRLRLCWFW